MASGGPTKEQLAALAENLDLGLTINYLRDAAFSVFLFHYVTTVDEEVSKIWKERLNLGKLLFLTTRYSLLFRILIDSFINFPTEINVSAKACEGLYLIVSVLSWITTYSVVGSLLLCLHALLGAKRRYLFIIIPTIIVFPTVAMSFAAMFFKDLKYAQSTYTNLFVCSVTVAEPNGSAWSSYSTYLACVREIVTAVASAFTLFKRFRHENSLIRVMLRDGAIYYTTSCVMGLLQAIFTAPNFPVQDKYQVLSVSRMVLNPILANRLLLNLRSNRDPGTQAAISTLLFDKPNPSPFSREESFNETADYIGEGPYVTGDEKEVKGV